MQKFSKLSKEEFEKELNNFIIKNPQFKEISNINDFKEKTGYYLLVLDEYKQIYIGTSNTSLRNRIYKHMSENILFENFLFPPIEDNFNIESVKISMEQSKLSINTFRPLDFTRVFIFETTESFDKEEYFIRQFSNKFVSNRIEGGHIYNFNEDCYIKAKFLKD